ncbi:GcrA family cell cycle regulator [Pseudopontixanthobacter vadosimaris]|uniref:GcrA family cell cycle regulator n=1 Tax=Pseudopontixanthobacter vadosimaris TaxID=2726450 RepID=UPI001473DE53|nr:GcrA family cell cycle regulator [Pseudopontixanthobacter vadosimaris]
MSWTEERIATLKKLWEGGNTASQIAEELGGVSRNAVIGKAHRLGLKSRPSPVKANAKGSAKSTGKSAAKAESAPAEKKSAAPAQSAKDQPRDVPSAARPAENPAPASPAPAAPKAEPAPTARPADESVSPAAVSGEAARPVADQPAPARSGQGKVVSVGPGGFLRQGPGDQQPPIPPAPPRRLVPARPAPEIADKTSLLDLSDKVCRWPMGHPGEADFHFCGTAVNPGFPYCVEHCGRAYQAQLPRGQRRPPPPLPFGGPRVR